MPNIEHVTIYKEPGRYACFPSLSIDPETETLYTSFASKGQATHHDTPGDQRICMESRDGGRTWQRIDAIPADAESDMPGPEFKAPDGALIRISHGWWQWLPNERLPAFEDRYRITPGNASRGPSSNHFAILTGGYAERSEDGGKTWEKTLIPELDTYVSGSSPWSSAQLPDGTVMRAFMVQEREDLKRQVYAAMTRDGRTAEAVRVMGEEPGGPLTFTEETLLHVTSDGVVWMLTRVHGEGDYLWQAVSRDGGQTWTSRRTDIQFGRTPPSALAELDDGRLVLIMGYRLAPFGIRALVSEDEGLTWRMDHEFVLRHDGGGSDLGYPRAVKLSDGTVVTLYYYHTADEIRHIACSRFKAPPLE